MKHMAHKGTPLAYTPDGPYWPDDLGTTTRERVRFFLLHAVAFVVVLAFVLLLSLPGN